MKQLRFLSAALLTSTALALTALAGPEPLPSGKEMKQVAPAPPMCDYTWTGFYVGANVGYSWGNADTRFDPRPDEVSFFDLAPTTLDPEPDGVSGGGQIGFNWQFARHWMVGVEADFQGSDLDDTRFESPVVNIAGNTFGPDTFLGTHEDIDWWGSFRMRLGFVPFCRLLVYGTGGLAWGHVNYAANTAFSPDGGVDYPTIFDETQVGWCAGGGLEYALTHHWSLKIEYLYFDLGDESRTVNPIPANPPFQVHYNWETQAHTVRGGLNFKF